ncbi:unnamed protein product [Gadus morhua 'NCC']
MPSVSSGPSRKRQLLNPEGGTARIMGATVGPYPSASVSSQQTRRKGFGDPKGVTTSTELKKKGKPDLTR